jgi:methyl-accepting chemotaxis protein
VAERAGHIIADLVPYMKKTVDLVQEVAAVSKEQTNGVSDIAQTMGQIDQVTQRNASIGEELASTAEEMYSQAEGLQQLISFFRIKEEKGAAKMAQKGDPKAVRGLQRLMNKPAPEVLSLVSPHSAGGPVVGKDFKKF